MFFDAEDDFVDAANHTGNGIEVTVNSQTYEVQNVGDQRSDSRIIHEDVDAKLLSIPEESATRNNGEDDYELDIDISSSTISSISTFDEDY